MSFLIAHTTARFDLLALITLVGNQMQEDEQGQGRP